MHSTSNCSLSQAGLTLYGTFDMGYGYNTAGMPYGNSLWHALRHLFPVLCLLSEAQPLGYPSRPQGKETGGHTSSARDGQRSFGPSPPAAGKWRLAGGA